MNSMMKILSDPNQAMAFIKGTGEGLYHGAKEMVEVTKGMVEHPWETAKGLYQMIEDVIKDPKKIVGLIGNITGAADALEIIEALERGDSYEVGRLSGKMAAPLIVGLATGGGAAVASKVISKGSSVIKKAFKTISSKKLKGHGGTPSPPKHSCGKPDSPGSCFIAGTLIASASLYYIPIEKIILAIAI